MINKNIYIRRKWVDKDNLDLLALDYGIIRSS